MMEKWLLFSVTEESLCSRQKREMGEGGRAGPFPRGFEPQTWSCPYVELMPSSCWLETFTNQHNAKEAWYGRGKRRFELLEFSFYCSFEQNLWQGLQLLVTCINYLLCARKSSKKIT